MQIESARIKETKLHLCVKSEPKHIYMLEVLVNGKRREEAVISDFDKVVLDLSEVARSVREVTVRGYDRYLHCVEQTAKVERNMI